MGRISKEKMEANRQVRRIAKRCPKCGILKNIDEFHKNKSRWDGHADWCKECKIAGCKKAPNYGKGYKKVSATEKLKRNLNRRITRLKKTLAELELLREQMEIRSEDEP